MIEEKKTYTIDGTTYTVVRTSEWYNDETTIEYWIYLGVDLNLNLLDSIGTVDDDELEDADENDMPGELAVKVALNRCSKRALSPREYTEWTLKGLERQEAHAARQVFWAKKAHASAVKSAPDAYKRAEEEVARAAEDLEARENRLAQLQVEIADAHVQLKNGQ